MTQKSNKNRDKKLNEDKAAAFRLGRLANKFDFYLRQAVALAVLPKEPYLHGYYEHLYLELTKESLSRIEQEPALQMSAEAQIFLKFARSKLDLLSVAIARHDLGWHVINAKATARFPKDKVAFTGESRSSRRNDNKQKPIAVFRVSKICR